MNAFSALEINTLRPNVLREASLCWWGTESPHNTPWTAKWESVWRNDHECYDVSTRQATRVAVFMLWRVLERQFWVIYGKSSDKSTTLSELGKVKCLTTALRV